MARELNASIAAVNSAQTYAEYVKALTTSDGNFSADKYISGIAKASNSSSMEQPSSAGYSPIIHVQQYVDVTTPQWGNPQALAFYDALPRYTKPRKPENSKLKRVGSQDSGVAPRQKKKKINNDEIAIERLYRRESKKRTVESCRDLRVKPIEINIKKEEMSYDDEVKNAVTAILCDPDQNLVDPM